MGKGQRNRELRAVEREANRESLAKKAKKDKIKKLSISIVSIVLIVCLFGGLLVHFITAGVNTSGKAMRKAIALESENYKVNAAMMSYFFYTQYNQLLNDYNSYMEYIGLDTEASLKSQQCSFADEGTTWYDYFVDQASSQVKELLFLAEKAKDEGMKLDDEDAKAVDSNIATLEATAKENNLDLATFIPAAFGTGVKESDVRDCMELSLMANKYLTKFQESLDYSDKEVEAFYKKNMDSYRYVDYYYYTVSASDAEKKSTYAAAEKEAKELAAVKSTDAFAKWVEAYERKNAKITKDYTKEALEADISDTLSEMVYEGATYTKDDKASEWLFNKAKVGQTYINDDGKGSYTVYYCTATPYRDEEVTRTIRQIILTEENHGSMEEAKEAADAIIKEMAGKKLDEATFEAQAYEHNEDANTAMLGGLCENYTKASFDPNIAEWVYAKGRNPGDMELVKMEGGYAICFYVGKGLNAWEAACISAMEAEDYEEAKTKWEKENPLTENEKSYNKIPDIL